jgi:hypothetical protein
MLKLAIAIMGAATLSIVLIAASVGSIASLLGGKTACIPALSPIHDDQLTNAAAIAAIGQYLNVPERGRLVALVVAMQESGLHNVNHGDRDSLGLFQQRPSQGWGTPAQIMNPAYSATTFYRHLLATPAWQTMSINDAAQAVQQSGTPGAYAAHENSARALMDHLKDSVPITVYDHSCS